MNDETVWRNAFHYKWKCDILLSDSDDNSSGNEDSLNQFTKSLKELKINDEYNNNNNDNDYSDMYIHPRQRKPTKKQPKKAILNISNNTNKRKHKPWKQEFCERLFIERNWKQGRSNVMTLAGHSGSITDLKFDQYKLITASDDGSLILWQLNTMKKYKPRKMIRINNNNNNNDNNPKQNDNSDISMYKYRTQRNFSKLLDTKLLGKKPKDNFKNVLDSITQKGVFTWKKHKSNVALNTFGDIRHINNNNNVDTSHLIQNHHKLTDLNFKKRSFVGHGGPIWALDFDDELLISGSYDKTIKLWDLINAKCVHTLRGHNEWVSDVKLNDKQILSSSWDGTIKLWNLNDNRNHGRCSITLKNNDIQYNAGNAIYCIEWSKDKRFICCGCRHKAIQIWDITKAKIIKTFIGIHIFILFLMYIIYYNMLLLYRTHETSILSPNE